eukprot:TRINITY_DN1833_c0_g2_i3.p1 TRINITY_DN1833_c0_g2~~TRINITY_DN1833_c0_g2_i3.p1  ORF type:complete len:145 (-),score=21.72 TRINITY_DN1833_c0_g2_i3:143-532(-)
MCIRDRYMGINRTTRIIHKMLGQESFLRERVTPIVEPLIEDLLFKKPEDPIGHMVDYLARLIKEQPEGSLELSFEDVTPFTPLRKLQRSQRRKLSQSEGLERRKSQKRRRPRRERSLKRRRRCLTVARD